MNQFTTNPDFNWLQFRQGIKEKFTSTAESSTSIASIQNRKQTDNETFDSYWFGKLELIETKRPTLTTQDKIHFLIDGLKPNLQHRVMDKLITKPLDDIDQVRDLCKRTHELMKIRQPHFQEPQNQKKKYRNEKTYYANDQQHENRGRSENRGSNDYYRYRHGNGNRQTMDIQDLTKSLKDLTTHLTRRDNSYTRRNDTRQTPTQTYYNRGFNNRHSPSRSQNYGTSNKETGQSSPQSKDYSKRNPDLSQITCYNCNEKGHYATSCTKRDNKKKETRNDQGNAKSQRR